MGLTEHRASPLACRARRARSSGGSVTANGSIESVAAASISGDVTAGDGDIGFGGDSLGGINVSGSITGSVEALEGTIYMVRAGKITSPTITAGRNIDIVSASQSITGTKIAANGGSIGSVTVGPGGISGATIYAFNNIGCGFPDSFTDPITYDPYWLVDGVGSGGPISGCTINAAVAQQNGSEGDGGGDSSAGSALGSGNINKVVGLDISGTNINAAGYIQIVSAGNSIAGTIKAGGNIGTIATSGMAGYAWGLAQDVSANITAGGNISWMFVGRDLSGDVSAVNLPNVRVDRNLTGKITATGDIGSVYVQRSATADISGNTIGKVLVGYNLSGNVTSNNGIDGVSVGHTLSGNITAKAGGINVVAAGAVLLATPGVLDAYWTFAQNGAGTNQGSIQGATIKATGDIGWVSAVAGLGYGGDIKGATISAEDIGTVLTSGNLGATITATGSIGSVSSGRGGVTAGFVAAPPLTYANDGDISGTIKAGTSIGSVAANGSPFDPGVGSIEATITAGTDIGGLTATYDISGSVTAGHSLTGGLSAGRDITGAITATSGSISGATAGRDIDGALSAGQNIGNITAGRNIDGNITAGAVFPLPSGEGQGEGGSNSGGSSTTPTGVTSGQGNIGNVTAGTGPTGGDIAGDLKAGGSIGNVFAGGSADEKDISSLDTPAGLIGNGYEWWLNIDQADDTYTVDKPAGEPAPDGGGDIAGTISAGLTLGMVTAYGTISQALSAVQSISSVWALGDIDGSVTSGTGALNVNSWGTINGNLNAAGNITASAFNDLAGAVTSTLSGVNLTSWGDIAGAVQSQLNVSLWALNNIAAPSIISNFGIGAFTVFNNFVGSNVLVNNPFVHIALNIINCTFSSNPTGGATFTPGPAMIYAFNNITGTTVDISSLPGSPGTPNPFGYALVAAGGNITGSTIKASMGVDVLSGGDVTGDTIDTTAGTAFATALQNGGDVLGAFGPKSLLSVGTFVGQLQALAGAWGSVIGGLGNVIGYVNVMAKGDTNATINSPTIIDVETLNVSGTYNGADIDIDAWNGASFSSVNGSHSVNIFVHGSVSGPISSANGTVQIDASGNVLSDVIGKWSVAIETEGGCSGSTIKSSDGPVAVIAYGPVITESIQGKVYVDLTATNGGVTSNITTSGYVKLVAGGDVSGTISGGGNVEIVSFGDESANITAGNGGLPGAWSADIDAEGTVSGQITAPVDVTVDANGDISAQATGQYGEVILDAAGQITSPTVVGGADVTLLGAEGISAGTVTSQRSSITLRSADGDLTVGNGTAATAATVTASREVNATLNLSEDFGSATITAGGDATANITGNSVVASITSGGDANVNVQGPNGGGAGSGPSSVGVVALGVISGEISQAGKINLVGWGGIDANGSAIYSVSLQSGGSLEGTFSSLGSLWAESSGAVSADLSASAGDITVIGKLSVDGQVSDTTSGTATVTSQGEVGATVTTNIGDADITAGGAVSGAVSAGDDANITALGGAVSGAINAGDDATVLAAAGITQTITANQDVAVTSFGDVALKVTATTGAATLDVYGTLSGAVQAGTTATVYADTVNGNVSAGGDVSVSSKNTVVGSIEAGGDATVLSLQGVKGAVEATGSASVLAIGDVSGTVTTTNGGVTINCGGALSGEVQSGGDATLMSLGELSSTVTAGGGATLTGWADVESDVTTKTAGAVVNVDGNFSGSIEAAGSAQANVVGNNSAYITAGGDVTVDAGGAQSGDIDAGADVTVTSGGTCSATINAGGDVTVDALGDITSQVVAGADVEIDTWSNIDEASFQAGGDASLWAAGNLQATIKTLAGTVDAETLGTGQVQATAQGDVTLDALGAVTQTTLTSNAGSVDVEVSDDATLTVNAEADADLLVSGDLNGTVTTVDGDIDVQGLGNVQGSYEAGGSATVSALVGVSSGTSVTAADDAELRTIGDANDVTVSGDSDAEAWAGGALSGSVDSLSGDATLFSIGDMEVSSDAGADVSIDGLGSIQVTVSSGQSSYVFAAADLSGSVESGGDATLFSGGNMNVTVTAQGDVTLDSVGDMSGNATADQDLAASAFGNLNASDFHADNDVTLIWARGNVTGEISAGASIDAVDSYGAISASFSAPNIGTIAAFGSIGGSTNAPVALGTVESGQAVSASISSPSVGSVEQNVQGLLTDYPSTPVESDSAELEDRDQTQAELESLAAQLADEKAEALAALPADKAAATPSYQVSIGSFALAQAAFDVDAAKLAAAIADGKDASQEMLSGAQTSLTTFFNGEAVRFAVAKANAQALLTVLDKGLAQIAADREAAAKDDQASAQEIMGAASSARAASLEKLDHVRDVDWPTLFEDRFRARLLDRLQTTLDVIGFLDPTPLSDGANALISLLRGNLTDFWFSAGGALLPYAGDLAKVAKFGKYADDGLEAVRRVADDFVALAGKSLRYFDNACDAANALGRLGQKIGDLLPIGCFVTHTLAGSGGPIENQPPIFVHAEFPPPPDSTSLSGQVWTCVFVTIAVGGFSASNLRLRRKEREAQAAAVAALFGTDSENDFTSADEDFDLLAGSFARHSKRTPLDAIFAAAVEQLDGAGSPTVAGIGVSAKRVGMPSTGTTTYCKQQGRKEVTVGTADLSARSKRTVQRPRQSRLGLVWLVVFLGLAGWSALHAPTRLQRRPEPTVSASASPQIEPRRMKYIEDFRMGERLVVTNPLGGSGDGEPDPETWRRVELRMRKPSGKWLEMSLIQPPEWLEAEEPRRGRMVQLDLPEMGLSGEAEVLSVAPCPEIEPGEGCVVTGIFRHESDGNLVNIWLEGCQEPIGVTNNHPFFSQDRSEFIRAGDLRPGERLLTLSEAGTVRVVEVTPRPRDEMVYNLRVSGQHVYHVGPLGVLVHNECPWARLQKWANAQGGFRNPYTNKWESYSGTLAADHIFPKVKIEGLNGFDTLTPAQKSFLVNYPGNIQPLPKNFNSSKRDRLSRPWSQTPMGRAKDGFNEEYLRWLEETQTGMEAYFNELIQFFKKQNSGK